LYEELFGDEEDLENIEKFKLRFYILEKAIDLKN
jgi:hypothetical protein